jgi:hypothetical protein
MDEMHFFGDQPEKSPSRMDQFFRNNSKRSDDKGEVQKRGRYLGITAFQRDSVRPDEMDAIREQRYQRNLNQFESTLCPIPASNTKTTARTVAVSRMVLATVIDCHQRRFDGDKKRMDATQSPRRDRVRDEIDPCLATHRTHLNAQRECFMMSLKTLQADLMRLETGVKEVETQQETLTLTIRDTSHHLITIAQRINEDYLPKLSALKAQVTTLANNTRRLNNDMTELGYMALALVLTNLASLFWVVSLTFRKIRRWIRWETDAPLMAAAEGDGRKSNRILYGSSSTLLALSGGGGTNPMPSRRASLTNVADKDQ